MIIKICQQGRKHKATITATRRFGIGYKKQYNLDSQVSLIIHMEYQAPSQPASSKNPHPSVPFVGASSREETQEGVSCLLGIPPSSLRDRSWNPPLHYVYYYSWYLYYHLYHLMYWRHLMNTSTTVTVIHSSCFLLLLLP